MNAQLTCDEDLVHRLPLPLARLYRRAHNAKTPLERHLAAYYLWEAALKLLASAAVAEYARRPDPDPQLAERLQNLARPSLGHWWEFVRRLLPVLADAGDEGFGKVRDLVLGRSRDDLPRAAGLDAALREAMGQKGGARATVRLTELFDRLVSYRNEELGHGAAGQRGREFYERMGGTLLAGVAEVLGRLDVLAGRRLVYVAEVRQAAGHWQVQRYELAGESARQVEPLEVPRGETARLPNAEQVYLEGAAAAGAALALHPLLLYDAEAEEALFLNARRGRQRTEYLCYTTGRVLDRADLGPEQRELLARALGIPVGEAQATAWAARSQAEEPAAEDGPEPARRQVGEFELLSELGRGGMGKVYRAWQPSLGRQVALKVLLNSGDARSEARFAREIRALGRVEHPHLVKVFTSGSDGEQWFYAMELIEGVPLSAVCDRLQTRGGSATEVDLKTWQEMLSTACAESRRQEKPLGAAGPEGKAAHHSAFDVPTLAQTLSGARGGYVGQVAELVRQAARAAHALHEAGVVHRDVKPGNILVTADGSQAVLMDLGLAQLADEADGKLTRTRQFVGTLRYASPEQVLAARRVDRRTDVYSLGATLWELLTLRPLFGATEEMPTPELMERIQHEEPQPVRALCPGVPRDLEAIVHKCLEKNPAKRYSTALELAEDLRRFLAGEPVQARPITRLGKGWRWLKRHRLASSAAVLLVVGVAGGLWYWDSYHRVKVAYFATWAKRWGAPVGVGRLTEEQVRGRHVSHRFTSRAGRVEKVEMVNGQGFLTPRAGLGTIIAMHREGQQEDENRRPCSWEIEYDKEGKVLQETARDQAGRKLWGYRHTSPTMAHFTDARDYVRPAQGTGAAYVETAWTDDGLEREHAFKDVLGNPSPDPNGVYSQHYLFDGRGLVTEVTYFDRDGKPTLHRSGYAKMTLRHDEQGNVVEVAYFGLDGKPALHQDGCARWTARYDERGNRVETAFFGTDDKPAFLKDGYAGLGMRYDEHGNRVETAFFGTDGKPVRQKEGNARVTWGYDERGNVIEQAYFDADGKPTLNMNGVARWTFRYDERGNRVETTYCGTDGKPTLHKDGYARVASSYDDRGNRTELAYFGVDGKPCLHKDGNASVRWRYDDRGNRVEAAYCGTDGKPVLHRDGNARVTWTYDERGNKVGQAYFGIDGKPCLHKDGNASVRWRYDSNGNQVEAAYFGPDDRPCLLKNGYARASRRYDDRGNQVEAVFFGLDDKPTVNKDGYARIVTRHDERGNKVEQAYFGPGGKPCLCKEGNARATWRYDERGKVVEQTFFGTDGKPCPGKDGSAGWTARYDERGNRTEEAYFGPDGKPCLHANGYARMVMREDERGNLLEASFFGPDGKPCLHKDGNARATRRYDDRGNLVEMAFFDADGKPTLIKAGHAKLAGRYDERNNLVELAYLGIDGKPVLNPSGTAGWTARYDERGNRTEEAYFGTDGKPCLCKDGFAKLVLGYDERDNVAEMTYLGLDGKPVVHKDGDARAAWRYDERDNQVEAAFFDAEGKPTLLKKGYARWTARYDERDVRIDQTYYDTTGSVLPVRVRVTQVLAKSQAEKAGLQVKDVVVSYDGEPITGLPQFLHAVRRRAAGEKSGPVRLAVRRGEKEVTVEVRPGPVGLILQEDVGGHP
jgi:YD repeat-containing protein